MPLIYDKEQALLPTVTSLGTQLGVPPALILAHIKQESAFDPNAYRAEPAINDASYGLMQVLLKTAQMFNSEATPDDMYDPTFNMTVGTQYIAQNLSRYNGNIQDAIAAYNAGTARKNAAGQYVNSQGVTNVQNYVDKVYKNYLAYSDWLAQGATLVDIDASVALGIGVVFVGAMIYIWNET